MGKRRRPAPARASVRMNIIIHIGTQKTATSALQRFFLANKKNLLSNGLFYSYREGSKNANLLAGHAAHGRYAQLREYINNTVDESRRCGLDTILISGESFYAMNSFFSKLHDKECADYWYSERCMINNFRNCFPEGTNPRIICYFRRQDKFLESMYGQVVKSVVSYAGDINQFYEDLIESMDYAGHMDIWAEIFGIDNIQVRSYENAKTNICEDFLKNVLAIENTDIFVMKNMRINERLNRDVLEYKLILNHMNIPFVERYMNKQALSSVSKFMMDDGKYDNYLDPCQRDKVLRACEKGNDRLQSVYKMDAFPVFNIEKSLATWRPYPGLSVDKSIEITMRYLYLRNSFSFKLESYARGMSYLLRKKIKYLAWIVTLGRKLGLLRLIDMLR